MPVEVPLILINQAPRSGGTLLSQLFDGHPECFTHPHELMWGKYRRKEWPAIDLLLNNPWRAFNELSEPWVEETLARGYYQKGREGKVADRLPFAFDPALQWSIFNEHMRKSPPRNEREALNHYLTSFFNAWLDCQGLYHSGKRYVTAFGPEIISNEKSVARFFRDYPDGYLISIVRNPQTWFFSRRAHTKVAKDQLNESELLASWGRVVQKALDAKGRYGDRIILVLFEDLLQYTEAIMHEITDTIGLTFVRELTVPTFNTMPIGSNSSFASRKEVSREPLTRGQEPLSADIEQELVHTYLPLYEQVAERIRSGGRGKHIV